MTRARIKELKRLVMAGMRVEASPADRQAASESALLLLQRSIAMRHDKLFLHRLADVLMLGVAVDASARAHCAAIARDPARSATLAPMLRKIHPCLPTLVGDMAEQQLGACFGACFEDTASADGRHTPAHAQRHAKYRTRAAHPAGARGAR